MPSSLDKATLDINTTSVDHDFKHFQTELTKLSKTKIDEILNINDAKTNRVSNLLAFNELINTAKNEIKIYTSHIRGDIYGSSLIANSIKIWLKGDSNRKILFLVRENFDIKNTKEFYPVIEEFGSQIKIRRITLKNAKSCNKNAVIVDDCAIKLKTIKNNIEYVSINFGAKELAHKLSLLFDFHFLSDNNSCKLDFCSVKRFDLTQDYIGELVDLILAKSKPNISFSAG